VTETLTFTAYHLYIELQHLNERVEKVGLISRRQTERLLIGDQEHWRNPCASGPGLSSDPEGTICREEINRYAEQMGFHGTGLIHCFNECVLHTGKDSMPITEFSRCFDDYTDKLANEADADGDGKLDIHEIEAMEAKIKAYHMEQEAQINALDADNDGKISKAEWIAMHGNADEYQGTDSDSELEIVLDDVTEAQHKNDAAGQPGDPLNPLASPGAQLGDPKIDDRSLDDSQSVAVGTTEALFIDHIEQNPITRGNGNSDAGLQNVVDDVADAHIGEADAARGEPKTHQQIAKDERAELWQQDGDDQI